MTDDIAVLPGVSNSSRYSRRVLSSVAEQGSFSAFQFSPIVAAILSEQTNSLAWTASFSACLGLVIATYRGAVVQPVVRSTGDGPRTFSGRSFAAASVALMLVLIPLGIVGGFKNQGSLLALGLAAPFIGLVEMNRVSQSLDRRRVATALTTGFLAVAVALFPLYWRTPVTPFNIALVWGGCWSLTVLRFAFSEDFVKPSADPSATTDGSWSLTLNNLMGQLAAQGPLLLVAAFLSTPALAALQAARVPLRPITILAAALPVHYLPFLVENDHRRHRWYRSAQVVIGISAAVAVVLVIASLLFLRGFDDFTDLGIGVMILAAVVGLISITEALVGVAAIATGIERIAISVRGLAFGATCMVLAGLVITETLGTATSLLALGLTPAITSGVVGRVIKWT